MEQVRSYQVDEPVDRPVFTKEDMMRHLNNIRELLINNGVGMFDLSSFEYDAEYIVSCYHYLESRLQHSEMERFNR